LQSTNHFTWADAVVAVEIKAVTKQPATITSFVSPDIFDLASLALSAGE
jgi:hypothetical protein